MITEFYKTKGRYNQSSSDNEIEEEEVKGDMFVKKDLLINSYTSPEKVEKLKEDGV